MNALAVRRKSGPADDDIKQQIAGQDYEVPEHDRVRCGEKHDVHYAHRLAHVHEDEQDAHRDRRDREELSHDHDLAELLEVVEIIGYYEHHGRGRHADQECELADVQAP